MKSSDAFPSKFISAADLQDKEVTVKITHIAADEIGGKKKYVCYFAGKQKGLVLNKTNFNAIVRISGYDDTDDWTGVDVCLYPAMVDFQGDSVPAVRVKAPPTAQRKQAPVRQASADMSRHEPPPHTMIPQDMNDEIPF